MQSREFDELKVIVDRIEGKVDTMVISLKKCQGRCHVENPPKGWRRWFKSLSSFIFLLFI
jgi:hypothetical protein